MVVDLKFLFKCCCLCFKAVGFRFDGFFLFLPLALMASESIALADEDRMGYSLRAHSGIIVISIKQWIAFFTRSDWLLKLGKSSAIHLRAKPNSC